MQIMMMVPATVLFLMTVRERRVVKNFSIVNESSTFAIIAPTSGDHLTGGDDFDVEWQFADNFNILELSLYQSGIFQRIVTDNLDPDADAHHRWSVPTNISGESFYLTAG